VGLPTNNLSILALARKLGQEVRPPPIPAPGAERKLWVAGQRSQLREVLRYRSVRIARPWAVASARSTTLDAASYLFEMDNGLCANGVLAGAALHRTNAAATLILNDGGKARSIDAVADRVNQGELTLALDLLFIGDGWRKVPYSGYAQMIHGLGERSLGLVVGQLIEIAHWLRQQTGATRLKVDATGLRSQTAALAAAALEPGLFSNLSIHQGAPTLRHILDKPVQFSDAPELFCLDLLKGFDFDQLQALAEGTLVEAVN